MIAKEGLYLNKCMAWIIKESQPKTGMQEIPAQNVHDEAFQHLRDEIEPDLFTHEKVVLLPTMHNRFKMLLSESDSEEVTYP